MVVLLRIFPYCHSLKGADLYILGGGEIWYGDSPYYVKLVGAPELMPGTYCGMKADLPRYNCDLETIGNDDRKV